MAFAFHKQGKAKQSWLVIIGIIIGVLFLLNVKSSLPTGLFAVYGEVACETNLAAVKVQRNIPSSYACSLVPVSTRPDDCTVFCRDSSVKEGQSCIYASDCGFGEICSSGHCAKDICSSGEQLTAYGCLPVTQKRGESVNLGNVGTISLPKTDLGKINFGVSDKTIQTIAVLGMLGLVGYILLKL